MFSKRLNTLYKHIDRIDEEAGKFALSIAIFSSNLYNVAGTIQRMCISNHHYLIYIRMLIDACTDVKAALLVNNKARFYKHYLSGKTTDNFKIGNSCLSTSYLLEELEKEFEGITAMYKECCKWIHPTSYHIVRLGKYRKKGEEFIGYRGRTYTKMMKERKDIMADFEYCQQVLIELLTRLRTHYRTTTQTT